MKIQASYQKYILEFKNPAGTSRGILRTKDTYFILLTRGASKGIGECGLLRGLSVDDRPDYETKLQWVCDNISLGLEALYEELTEFPSIQIGLEIAFRSLNAEDEFQIFPSDFSKGKAQISINGLIWMGDKEFMNRQIKEKIASGFRCIKMKIGAIDFKTELDLLKSMRNEFSVSEMEIRVDANGAFQPSEALDKLDQLAALDIHSIEQPIAARQWEEMARLCEETSLPIALDEELIGVFTSEEKKKLLATISPQYIILKPSFVGGFKGTDEWINLAEQNNLGWWVTSALESNVGLNAISQYTFTKNSTLPQGLGTGGLYINNIESPLEIRNGSLAYATNGKWKLNQFHFKK